MPGIVAHFPTSLPLLLIILDFLLSQYSSLNFEIIYFKFQFIFIFVIIEQLIYLIIWIKSTNLSLNLPITSTLHQSITTVDSNDTMYDSGRNLMHQTND